MKSKLTITVASILSVLTLVGVGFAAWVISNPSVSADQNGTITAETVSDKSYTLEAKIDGGEIVFGAPKTPDPKITTPWLTNSTVEDLTATLTLTIKYNEWVYVPKNFSITMATTNENSVFNSLRDGVEFNTKKIKIIDNPTISYGSLSTVKPVTMNGTDATTIEREAFTNNSDTKTATLTVTITFKWGENGNPYNYYNNQGYAAYREEAKTVLGELYKLNAETYKITISGTTNVSGK